MFFGKPFQNFRSFDELFRLRSDVEWSHHIFRQFAAEYKGDARASSLLFAIYNRRQRETVVRKLKEAEAARDGVLDKSTFDTSNAKVFAKLFDELCRRSFINTLTKFNDYN